MSAKYGVNISLTNKASSAIEIDNTNPIALIGDDTSLVGLSLYNSVDEALAKVNEGTLKNALNDLKACGLKTQVILSSFVKSGEGDENAKKIADNKACVNSINELKNVENTLKIKPRFILAPEYNDTGVQNTLNTVATSLRAIYAIELDKKSETEIKTALESISTKRAIISFQKVVRNDSVIRPASSFLIACYAKVMSESPFGFSETYSNKVVAGITSLQDVVEHLQGEDSLSDRLRALGVTTLFIDKGIRAWGGETRDKDFPSLHTVVVLDRIIEALFNSCKDAIDRRVKDVLGFSIQSINNFQQNLIGANVLLGYLVSLPKDKNTNESLAKGQVSLQVDLQVMPLLKQFNILLVQVDSFSQELVKQIA
ncbi:phage tail protein [Helicobacter sp. 11S02629-2]|uniref:phage tail protein n=1 Tax=Helicobacter sp. 11S02629-2 TaxID=1476195 RepID=UPI000BA5ECFF|nr:phage tail protein [Helicobacter sp. 11S02629-2]PAF44167.1 phage tail protein [Helicobacter sp. 11S02629-2]